MRAFIAAAIAAVASAEIVVDSTVPEDHCCKYYASKEFMIDTEDSSDTQANKYSTMEVCLNTSFLLDTHVVTAESFRGNSGDVDNSYFNDTMESFKCGRNVGTAICDVISASAQVPDEINGGTMLELTCAERTLSTSAPGDWNPDYHNGMNRASAVILYPANECITMYTMYEGDNCKGRSKSSHISYKTEAELMKAIDHFNLQGDNTKPVIRSIKHPRASSIEVFAEENSADMGSFYSGYLDDVDGERDEEDTICTTFRFQGVVEDATADGVLSRPMPQKSLEFLYKDCPSDAPQLHSYWVPE